MTDRDCDDVDRNGRRLAGQSQTIVKLGDVLAQVMEERIAPEQARLQLAAGQWAELLPHELGRHSTIAGVSGGQLKVVVDTAAYMYELRLRSAQLVEQLQRRCPRARISTIKLTLG